jgi:adenine deaminase
MTLEELIDAALGNTKADVIIKGGSLINVFTGEVYKADVSIYGGRIISAGDSTKYAGANTRVVNADGLFLSPGFIDGHLHFEVSKLSFTMLSKLLVPFGTTSIISGLDETFSVFGEAGVDSTIAESKASPLRLFFAVPSKLPYTIPSSTLKHEVDVGVLERQLPKEYTYGIWETVTEFITNKDADVLTGLASAKGLHKHAFGCLPLARGSILNAVTAAGVRLDHESYTPEEMLEKVRNGLFVMIRESTVTHFLDKNIEVITKYGIPSNRVGFCTDDVLSCDVLKRGHLDNVIRMAIGKGIPPMEAYQMATINTAIMYLIDDEVGVIAPGRHADLVFLSDMQSVKVKGVMTHGSLVTWDREFVSKVVAPTRESWMLNTFDVKEMVRPSRIRVEAPIKMGEAVVIGVKVRDDNPFRRTGERFGAKVVDGEVLADAEQDLLYVTVVERHKRTGLIATAFVTGFNLKYGAIASSAAPDDNNIIAVGDSKQDLALAINQVIDMKGGQVVASKGAIKKTIALPIGGILADVDPAEMAKEELTLDQMSHEIGSKLESPMNSMIFLPVTAIPDYAMTDKGLVDCKKLEIVSPVVECN